MKQLSFFMAITAMLLIASCTPKTTETISEPQESLGILFVEDQSYESILAKAKEEGKPVLIDFYTTWCAPCKWLEKDVFSLPQVYEYYNTNVVNYKVNAEDFDGVALAQQYEVNAYPTLVYLTQDGDFIRKHEGMTTATKFIKWGKEAVVQNNEVK